MTRQSPHGDFTIHDVEQRSPQWHQLRLGRLTSSKADDAIRPATKTGGEPVTRRDYRYQLIAERLSGRPCGSDYQNADMQWGTEHEADALAAYEAHAGVLVEPVGFCALNAEQMGCSPDGVIGDFEGTVSIKCPRTANHLKYLRDGRVPPEYLPQVLCELRVTGAKWVDFVSFDPRLPDSWSLFVVRYDRDEDALSRFWTAAKAFLTEVEQEVEALRTMANVRGQLVAAGAVA